MESDIPRPNKKLIITLSSMVLVLFAYGFYHYILVVKEIHSTRKELSGTQKNLAAATLEFATTTAEFQNRINDLQDELTLSQNENTVLREKLSDEEAQSYFLKEQVGGLRSAVSTLETLTKTDRELLKKYSKVYFLNENYKPSGIIDIDSQYLYKKDEPFKIHANVWLYFKKLLEAAAADNTPLEIISAYRSFGTQAVLKSGYTMTYGAGSANQFSADQGYSEHQLGTAVDFTTPALGLAFVKFETSTAYKWLNENAHKYGFILSYPKQNTYYRFEPWHWRFVGVDLAGKLHFKNIYFYDLDQREIDLYLISLFN